jgi:hypothetical protein
VSPCDTCPRPGACCQAFPLSILLPRDFAAAQAHWQEIKERNNLPFELLSDSLCVLHKSKHIPTFDPRKGEITP